MRSARDSETRKRGHGSAACPDGATRETILSKLAPQTEVLVIMQPDGPGPMPDGPDFDGCRHELACEMFCEDSDVVLAAVDGQPAWLVARAE